MQSIMICLTVGIVLFACADKNAQPPVSPPIIVLSENALDTSTKSAADTGLKDVTETDDVRSEHREPRVKWICRYSISDQCREQIDSESPDPQWLKTNCPSCHPVTERLIGTPSEEALRVETGEEAIVTEIYDRIGSTEFSSLIDLFALCHKGNVNCQDYYMDGVLNLEYESGRKQTEVVLTDYADYRKRTNPEYSDWRQAPMIILRMPNNLVDEIKLQIPHGLTECVNCKGDWKRRTNYKLLFRKVLWKYTNDLTDRFPFTNPDAPRDTTIVQGKHSLLANADQIEVFYDPDNLLKPVMRIYPEELAAEEDAKDFVWNDDAVKKSGLKSVQLIDVTPEILDAMEKNPYINKPAQ